MKVHSVAEPEDTEDGWSTIEIEATKEEQAIVLELGFQVLFLTSAYGISYKDLVQLCKEKYGDPTNQNNQ